MVVQPQPKPCTNVFVFLFVVCAFVCADSEYCPPESKDNVQLLMSTRFEALSNDQLLSLLINSEKRQLFEKDILILQQKTPSHRGQKKKNTGSSPQQEEEDMGGDSDSVLSFHEDDEDESVEQREDLKHRFVEYYSGLLCKGLFGNTEDLNEM